MFCFQIAGNFYKKQVTCDDIGVNKRFFFRIIVSSFIIRLSGIWIETELETRVIIASVNEILTKVIRMGMEKETHVLRILTEMVSP